MRLSDPERERYRRHLTLDEVGEAGQQRLKAARVLLVGAGGLGAPAALYLAAAGIGKLGLVDDDDIELSNLQRQVLYSTTDLGRGKAVTARERLARLNPEIEVVAHETALTAENAAALIGAYDIVLDGTDRLSSRYLVNDACVLLGKPLVTAAIHQFEGQATTYVPGQGPCYRCLFPDAEDTWGAGCAEAGVIGVLPGVLGTLQALEAIKLILGRGSPLVGRFLSFDALDLRFQEFRYSRRDDCAVCGDTPTILSLEPAPPVIDAAELRRRLSREHGPPLLIDVREPDEFAASHIDGARNVPLAGLPASLDRWPSDAEIVFVCESGRRSLSACRQARRAGFLSTVSLDGGMSVLRSGAGEEACAAVAPEIRIVGRRQRDVD